MRAAATDPRIKAVTGIAGGYNSPSHFADQMCTAAYRWRPWHVPCPLRRGTAGCGFRWPAMAGDEPYAYYGTAPIDVTALENQDTSGSLPLR
ncbi:MAG: uncharacterized protein QOE61_5864 [Micromonosporaceae bacterium]|nr:uncharacterized protein [Micromonosporaceae bacterium]